MKNKSNSLKLKKNAPYYGRFFYIHHDKFLPPIRLGAESEGLTCEKFSKLANVEEKM